MKVAPTGGGAPPDAQPQGGFEGRLPSLDIGALALLVAVFVPVVVALQPRPEIALGW